MKTEPSSIDGMELPELPDVLSGEQVRQMLHISKRKCAWMLQNGILPCRDNGQPTHRYSVALADAVAFAEDWQAHPEDHGHPAVCRERILQAGKKGRKHCTSTAPAGFRRWLNKFWARRSDALPLEEAAKLLGYQLPQMQKWAREGKLQSVRVSGKTYTSRAWMIDFCCDAGYRLPEKSEKHQKLLRRYFKIK